METPLISIVIAVYNVEDYVKRCLCSIEKQKKNFEVIIIDDGSTDNSGTICDLWASGKSYAHVYHQKNQGISKTRNNGVKYSCASFIVFIDPDDWIEPSYTKTIQKLIENYGGIQKVDIVAYNYSWVKFKNHNVVPFKNGVTYLEDYVSGRQALKWLLQTKITNYAWQYVVKRDIYVKNDIEFPNMILYEDAATIYRLLYFANNIVCTNQSLYNYFQRSGSFSNSAKLTRTTEYFKLFNQMTDFFRNHNQNQMFEVAKEYRLMRLFTGYANVVRLKLDNQERKKYYNILSQMIKDNFVKKPVHKATSIKQFLFYIHLFKLSIYIHDWMDKK